MQIFLTVIIALNTFLSILSFSTTGITIMTHISTGRSSIEQSLKFEHLIILERRLRFP